MQINIRGVHLELTPSLKNYVQEKIGGLDKYLDGIIRADIDLIYDKSEKEGRQNIIKVTLVVPGNDIRTEEKSDEMYASIDLIEVKLQRLIKKYKTKRNPSRFKKQKEILRRLFGRGE